jgi:polyferredoxin
MIAVPLQQHRFALQLGFFALFVLAPVLDLLRFDLTRGHAYLLGWEWTLGLSGFIDGEVGAGTVALNLLLRGLLPILLVGGGLLYVAWRWGRLYCGWLCPHFSVVETINGLMRRASGRPSLWERKPLPELEPDGTRLRRNAWYWLPTLAAVLGFAFLWAVVLLTYLLPPALVYGGLLSGTLARGPSLFILFATLAFTVEFLLARHLFCRFGCAVGLFQSLAWMANDRAMVIGFDGARADVCHDCNNACDNACPMRLKPRTLKRRMFTCTECAQCISACTQVQAGGLGDARLATHPRPSLLRWVEGAGALPVVTGRPAVPEEPQRLAPSERALEAEQPVSPAGDGPALDRQGKPSSRARATNPRVLGAFTVDPPARRQQHQASSLAPADAAGASRRAGRH